MDAVLTQLLGPEAMAAEAVDVPPAFQGTKGMSKVVIEMRRLGNEPGEVGPPLQDGGAAAAPLAASSSLLPESLSVDDFLGELRTALGARSYRKKRALDAETSDSAGTALPPSPPILTP